MKVYAVEFDDGNYDGRGNVIGIFSTKDKAKEFIANSDSYARRCMDITDYTLDEESK